MKKVLAVIAVVAVVCVAGAAFAQTRGHEQARRMPPQLQKEFSGERGHLDQRMPGQRFGRAEDCDGNREFCGRGHRSGRLGIAPDMPEEIRAKAVEAAKLRIDLEAVLSAKPLDKEKAMEVFSKIQQAENEVRMWRFSKRLERMEAFMTQRELNRNVPPATQAPKPEE